MSDENGGTAVLLKAIAFAARKHSTQRRKNVDASPYINHPIAVAHVLADTGGITDLATLMAAVLHDTIEDTKTTPTELEEQFGQTVRKVVEEMTDDKKLDKAVRKQLQIEHAPKLSRRAKAIKLADKIANIQDVTDCPPATWDLAERTEYLDWTEKVVAGAGSIAAFPPPHNFFWARESAQNLGYNWYRKDSASSFSFGIRQAENEEEVRIQGNFALYTARPGTEQHMPVFYYVSADPADAAREAVLAFTHGDRFKAIPGYQVMNHHYHMALGARLRAAGSADAEIEDLAAIKALGINIVSPIEAVGLNPASGQVRPDTLEIRRFQIEGARRHSDKDFLVLPNDEFYDSFYGGHTDLLYSRHTNWRYGRKPGQPLVEEIAPYGQVYNLGSAEDLLEMVRRENILVSYPHPRSKNNTGFPDGFKEKDYFKDPTFHSIGFRWGMGIDRSERRLCEYRCLALLDDISNWQADLPTPPKYLLAISEVQEQTAHDDIYASAPVSYLHLASLPTPDDATPVLDTLKRGDYFVTSGEVLIPSYSVQGTGSRRTIVADVEWTFPLDFVEVVWGDGQRTDRQIISTTSLPAFGKHHFEIPFDATGKKWVRFAAWDTAGNGAAVQPVKLNLPAK